MPRINKAIELLAEGQPVYYRRVADPAEQNYSAGVALARTWADYIDYNMELTPFDIPRLREFMRGLVDGGPTRSGHRTPAVIVTMPLEGRNEQTIRANAWIIRQLLNTGVHGLHLCLAETPEAVRAFVETCRFAFHRKGVGEGLDEGRRGHSDEKSPACIWGISVAEYKRRADVWPLNPEGELMLGVKIETKWCVENCEDTVCVPGLCFGEWGVNDMSLSMGYASTPPKPYPQEIQAARSRIMAACRSAGLLFQEDAGADEIAAQIEGGVTIFATNGGSDEGAATAEIGRQHTKRSMPW
jgi:4-hydroxy-2-oxoheptanedioate aldolase